MKPYKHQETISIQAYDILKKNYLVYLAMEERTGKTLTAILVAEMSKASDVLVITKKKAIVGWDDTIEAYKPSKNYTIINYESLHKITGSFDLVIIDEAHANLSAYPIVTKTWKTTFKFTKGKPIIFLSATPSAQTYAQLFHQLKLSSWSPFKHKNFYDWHREHGIEQIIYIGGRTIKQYNQVRPTVFDKVKHLFISYTRRELGFEHEPNDVLHLITLSESAKSLYNELLKHNVIKSMEYIADTPMKLLLGLHQLEGGTLKQEDRMNILGNTEKVDYILNTFGDSEDIVIFYHYQNELTKLKKYFKKATVLQATSFAEGVDLSMYKTLIIYSMDFSTARYTQRRARQCNMKREGFIDVHYILVEGAISHQVYQTVALNKSNFVDKYFNREEI